MTTKELASLLGVSTTIVYRNMIKLEQEGKVYKYGYKTRDGWEDAQHSNLKSNSLGWEIHSNPESMAKGGMTMGLSKEQTKRIAQKFADALSRRDNVDVSVNKNLEEDSFDLDYDGIEYAGGSYTILANGDVRNDALSNMPIYGNAKDSVQTIIKKIDHADSGYMAKGGFFEHGLEVGDKIISHKLKDDSIIVENHFRHERARVDLEKGKRSLIERNKLKYAKGGNVPSIEKKVAEVNELIREGNEKGVEVIDTSTTWQSPMKYKPFKYSNGVLYEEYEELNLYSYNRGEGTKWETKKFKFKKNSSLGIDDQKDVLNQVARWYRKAIKHFDTYGYDDGGVVYVDLFEDYENIPKKVGKILDRYYDRYGEDMDYKDTQNMLEEVEEVGYTFDYYLDNIPYGLRPIGVELNQLRGYEDMD
jgi:DNA-binding transcriptional regulator YhcF (GntR family)